MALGLKVRITFPAYMKPVQVVPCHVKTAGNRGKAFPFFISIRGEHSDRKAGRIFRRRRRLHGARDPGEEAEVGSAQQLLATSSEAAATFWKPLSKVKSAQGEHDPKLHSPPLPPKPRRQRSPPSMCPLLLHSPSSSRMSSAPSAHTSYREVRTAQSPQLGTGLPTEHLSSKGDTLRARSVGTKTIKCMRKSPWGLTPFICIHTKQGLQQVGIQKLHG